MRIVASFLPLGVRPASQSAVIPRFDNRINLLKDWLAKCHYDHGDSCSNTEVAGKYQCPSRMLFVGSAAATGRVFLRNEIGPDVRYTTLTYVWGQSQFCKTSLNNVNDFTESGVALKDLRKDFQDAIEITQALGISYIWIDALCIIQDDTEDWRRECAKMASIYERSSLTLAAAGFLSETEGLLFQCYTQVLPLPLPFDGVTVSIRRIIPHPYIDNQGSSGHLNRKRRLMFSSTPGAHHTVFSRGWCFQELSMSSRVAFFGADELIWTCRGANDGSRCECRAYDRNWRVNSVQRALSVILAHGSDAEGGKDKMDVSRAKGLRHVEPLPSLGLTWIEAIATYTRKQLTYEDDIFPAVSGLARKFHLKGLGHYFAGIWKDDVARGLMWSARTPRNPLGVRRPRSWRAPSWSWASVLGPVTWPDEFVKYNFKETIYEIDILDFQYRLRSSDPFGQIANAALTLRGSLVSGSLCRVRTYYGNESERHEHSVLHDSLLPGKGTYEERQGNPWTLKKISLDVDSPEAYAALENTPLYCLKIFQGQVIHSRSSEAKDMFTGETVQPESFFNCSLILRVSTSEEGHFERIGMHSELSTTSSSVYDGRLETILTII
jgi:hypothetical protein